MTYQQFLSDYYRSNGHWRHIGYRHGKPLYRWTPGKQFND